MYSVIPLVTCLYNIKAVRYMFHLSSPEHQFQYGAYCFGIVLSSLPMGDYCTPTTEETILRDQRRAWTSRGATSPTDNEATHYITCNSPVTASTVYHITDTTVKCINKLIVVQMVNNHLTSSTISRICDRFNKDPPLEP
jgi:hypothetical protein